MYKSMKFAECERCGSIVPDRLLNLQCVSRGQLILRDLSNLGHKLFHSRCAEGEFSIALPLKCRDDLRERASAFKILQHRELEKNTKQHCASVREFLALELDQLEPDVAEPVISEPDLEVAREHHFAQLPRRQWGDRWRGLASGRS